MDLTTPKGVEMHEYAEMTEDRKATATDALDQELERMERGIALLRERLNLVLTHEEPQAPQVLPANPSQSPLQGRALKLQDLNGEIDRIIQRLHI